MSGDDTDRALIDEIRAGSGRGFEELMRRYERLVYRIGHAYTHDHHAAIDVTQDVFLKVHEKLGSYRGSGPFRSWLLRLAHRQCLNWLRDNRKFRSEVALDPENAPAYPAPQESALIEHEHREQLFAALDRLNDRQRLAIALRYYERMPVGEIATVLECSEGVARNILFRGLERLRACLAAHRRRDHERVSSN